MFEQLKYFTALANIFFGENSVGTQALNALVGMVESLKSVFKARERDDITYMSKFLLVVDQRFQIWLSSCKRETDRSYVNDRVINFNSLIEQVQVRTFNAELPAAFKIKEGGGKSDETKQKKRGRVSDEDNSKTAKPKGELIKHEDKYDELKLRPGETWPLTFSGKGKIGRVDWDGNCKLCHRWFIAGNCLSTCKNEASHVAKSEISQDKIQALAAWMKRVRSE